MFSPVDAKIFATASSDNTVCIWTLSEGGKTSTLCHRLTDHAGCVMSIAWSSDGLFLVSGSHEGWAGTFEFGMFVIWSFNFL